MLTSLARRLIAHKPRLPSAAGRVFQETLGLGQVPPLPETERSSSPAVFGAVWAAVQRRHGAVQRCHGAAARVSPRLFADGPRSLSSATTCCAPICSPADLTPPAPLRASFRSRHRLRPPRSELRPSRLQAAYPTASAARASRRSLRHWPSCYRVRSKTLETRHRTRAKACWSLAGREGTS